MIAGRRAQCRHRRREDQGRQGGSITVAEAISDTIAKIGENMTLRRAAQARRSARAPSAITCIIRSVDGLGKIGVLVGARIDRQDGRTRRPRPQIAMHIAATNPQAIESAGLDPAVVEREKAVLADKFKAQGKPAKMIDKIVESGSQDYYKEVVPARAGLSSRRQENASRRRSKEAEGKVGAPIKVDRVRALRARRGHREAGNRFRRRSRGRRRRAPEAERRVARPEQDRAGGSEHEWTWPTPYKRVIVKMSGEALTGARRSASIGDVEHIAGRSGRRRQAGRRTRRRGRRRQYLPRRRRSPPRRAAPRRRHHGHAGDGDELLWCWKPRIERRGARRAHVGARHDGGLRNL